VEGTAYWKKDADFEISTACDIHDVTKYDVKTCLNW